MNRTEWEKEMESVGVEMDSFATAIDKGMEATHAIFPHYQKQPDEMKAVIKDLALALISPDIDADDRFLTATTMADALGLLGPGGKFLHP